MARPTRYKRALESLQASYRQRVSVSEVGGMYHNLQLLCDIETLRKRFEILKEEVSVSIDIEVDCDVDYAEWSKKENWQDDGIQQSVVVGVNEIGNISSVNLTMDYFRDGNEADSEFIMEYLGSVDKMRKYEVQLRGSILEAMGKLRKTMGELDNILKQRPTNAQYSMLATKIYNQYRYSRSAMRMHDQYLANQDSSSKPWTKVRKKEELYKFLKELLGSGFLQYEQISMSRKDKNKLSEELKDDEDLLKMTNEYAQFRDLVDYDAKKNIYVVDLCAVGKYIYKNRKKLTDELILVFVNFWMLMEKVYIEVSPENQNMELVTEEVIRGGLSLLIARFDWEGLYNEGYDKEMLAQFFDKLLKIKDKKIKSLILNKLKGDARSFRCYDVAVKGVMSCLGVLDGMGWFEKISEKEIYKNDVLVDGINKVNQSTLGSYIRQGRSKVDDWIASYDDEGLNAKVYEQIERVAKEVEMGGIKSLKKI